MRYGSNAPVVHLYDRGHSPLDEADRINRWVNLENLDSLRDI